MSGVRASLRCMMTADRTHSSFRYRYAPSSLLPFLTSFHHSSLLLIAFLSLIAVPLILNLTPLLPSPTLLSSHPLPFHPLPSPPLPLCQVVRILRDEFALAGLPIYLVPYSVVPSRTGNDNAPGGIIQVLIDTL